MWLVVLQLTHHHLYAMPFFKQKITNAEELEEEIPTDIARK